MKAELLLLFVSLGVAVELLTVFQVPNSYVISRLESTSGSSTFQNIEGNISGTDLVTGASDYIAIAKISANSTTVTIVDPNNGKVLGNIVIQEVLKVLVAGNGTLYGSTDIFTNSSQNATLDHFILVSMDPREFTHSQRDIKIQKSHEFTKISQVTYSTMDNMLYFTSSGLSNLRFMIVYLDELFLEFSPQLSFDSNLVDAVFVTQMSSVVLALTHNFRGNDSNAWYSIVTFNANWTRTLLYEFEMFDTKTMWSEVNAGVSILIGNDLYVEVGTYKQLGTLDLAHFDIGEVKPYGSVTLQTPEKYLYRKSYGLILAGKKPVPSDDNEDFWKVWKIALFVV